MGHGASDLYSQRRLEGKTDFDEFRFGGWRGFGFVEQRTDEFRNIFNYIQHKAQKVVEDGYPEKARILLDEMSKDSRLFMRRVCVTSSGDHLYHNIPILSFIEPALFVRTLLTQHPANQRYILITLKVRYEDGGLNRDLKQERPWLASVRAKLLAAGEGMTGIAKYRLLSCVRDEFDSDLGRGPVKESG